MKNGVRMYSVKKVLSLLMVIVLLCAFPPTIALAAGSDFTVSGDTGYTYDVSGVLTFTTSGSYTVSMTASGATTTSDKIVVASGITVNITLNGVSIDQSGVGGCAFAINGSTVNLTLAGDNTLKSGSNQAGLYCPNGSTLIIDGTGTLSATGGSNGAGIGGSNDGCGTVSIIGGTVNAQGGTAAAGIGGANSGEGGAVSITNSIVKAQGSTWSPGIGCGMYATNKGSLVITGGSVLVSGYKNLMPQATNGSEPVYCTIIDIGADTTNWDANVPIVSMTTNPDYSYGLDFKVPYDTQYDAFSTLYLWLPDATETSEMVLTNSDSVDITFLGSAVTTSSTILGTGSLAYDTTIMPPTISIIWKGLNDTLTFEFPEIMDINTGKVYLGTVSPETEITGCSWLNSWEFTVPFHVTEYDTEYNVIFSGFQDWYGNILQDTSFTIYSIEAPTLSIGTQPSNLSVLQNEAASLSVTVTGENRLVTYQWYSYTDEPQNPTLISGATSSTYQPSTSDLGTTYYYCVVTTTPVFTGEVCISRTSDVAAFGVFQIISKPTVTDTNNKAVLHITAEGSNTLTYQWYRNTADSNSGGTLITGATNSTYELSANDAGNTYYYYCVVGDLYSSSSVTSDTTSVSVIKDTSADLDSISVSAGTLNSYFDPDTVVYSVDATGIESIGITAVTADPGASIKINGVNGISGTEKNVNLSNGANLIPIVVTSQDGTTQKSYIISVNGTVSNADLSSLSLSLGTFNFSGGTTSYQMAVGSSETSISLSAASSDSKAIMLLDGEILPQNGTKSIPLVLGDNTIKVMVIAQDATTKTYTITVTRQEEITITNGSLPIGIVGGTYHTEMIASGGSGSYTWSSEGLPASLSINSATGAISGMLLDTDEGTYHVTVSAIDTNAVSISKSYTLTIQKGCGGGGYSIVSDGDAAYTGGYTADGIPTLTVNSGVSGFTYFGVNITPVTGHVGREVCIFVLMRDGVQIGFSFNRSDYDTVNNSGAGFNVKAGDVIKVYLVDELTNSSAGNPNIL